ncbi:type II secretion system F family protein [Ovoidimarina sediminis]|uniref:type II secretion system F family protein n=1 Tax=Ovoidimarina sediminis TaxID=3079856 RepID=UPI0029081286|nr:type II secretion system F family protein [Rhodophyticola sp. MJ-SS7]MDU8946033.1 type II secretion system F family protein [Rhodophyticola sp. MJ-SS7]
MQDFINELILRFDGETDLIIMLGVAVACFLIFYGLTSSVTSKDPAADRIAAANVKLQNRQNRGILQGPEFDPKGFLKTFIPADEGKRSELQRQLAQAGFPHPATMRKFIAIRIFLGLLFPMILVTLLFVGRTPGISIPGADGVANMSNETIIFAVIALTLAGYQLPAAWLGSRIKERKLRIQETFPNALDLLQVSVEAGLGFDAAMTRVGNELAEVSPEIAFEFLTVQRQVAAGRDRQRAMRDMADRCGVEVVHSFANVVHQSIQFGTSMSEALTTYAKEMRDYRETKAQEMANKLPVKMSLVLASLMLPSLILLSIGPTVLRYFRFYIE